MIIWFGAGGEGSDGPRPRVDLSWRGGPERRGPVMIVDDDTSILAMLTAIVEAEGYDVVTARNGREALDLLETITPSVILLDMRMPVLDGWAVAEALKRASRRIPIVVMTAAEDAERWAEEIAADGHLAKPFELNELLTTLERYRGLGDRLH